jgi:hypothetical protein
MALTATTVLTDNFQEQITFVDVYIRVEQVAASRIGSSADVIIYRKKDGQQLARQSYQFSADLKPGENHLKQAYEHLKTLPEFSDATDC